MERLEDRTLLSVGCSNAVNALAATTVIKGSFNKDYASSMPLPETATPTWVGFDIDARSLPTNATINKIVFHHVVDHERVSDLQVKLYNDTGTEWMVRKNTGGWVPGFSEYRTDTTVFAGQSPSQLFHYRVADTVLNGLTGTAEELEIWINYSVPSSTADLSVKSTHVGNFTQGQTNAAYTLTVTNTGTGPTSGTVSLKDVLPTGLTATSISGSGWTTNLATMTATRSNVLPVGASYPPLTVTVNVANDAPTSVINTAQVSGGGDTNTTNNTATDPTSIVPVAGAPKLVGENLSATQARDGQTITVGYQITSGVATSLVLNCTIVGPDGVVVQDKDNATTINVTPGTQWYTRSFTVNLPPSAVLGDYDVTYTIHNDLSGDSSATLADALKINAPIEVRVPILMYHNIAATSLDEYTTTISEFTAQMKALKAYGYTAVTIGDILDYRSGTKTPPAKPVAIVFDDGYESLLNIVLPILADPTINYCATSFISPAGVRPESVEGGWPTDPLSWSQIRQLDASGRIDIESHTVNHLDLTTLDAAELAAELAGSKATIEQELGGGKHVRFIAYPYGESNATVDTAVWQAGYSAGLRVDDEVEPTSADKFELKRVQIGENTSVQLDRSGWYEFFMSKVGDLDVRIPNLSVTGIQYLDPTTLNPVDITKVQPGQSVLIRVNVNNAAAPAGVIATLSLDADNNPDNGTIFNSHTSSPGQDVQVTCPWGASTFEWTWTVPVNASAGQYYVNVSFKDPKYVLGFKNSGWQTAFVVSSVGSSLASTLAASSTTTAISTIDKTSGTALKNDALFHEMASLVDRLMAQWTKSKQSLDKGKSAVQDILSVKQMEFLQSHFTALHDAVLAKSFEPSLLDWVDALLKS